MLPAGFVDFDRGTLRVIAARLELEEMVALLTGPERDAVMSGAASHGGRGGARRIVLPGGKAVYLRKYLRGGLVRHFVHDLYVLRPERPLRELIVTETARAAGCPVPTVLAVSVEEVGPFYRGWIVTEAIDGANPFIDVYVGATVQQRQGLLTALGRAVRLLHAAGVYHIDLTGYNALVGENTKITLIDFDRAQLGPANVARRMQRGLDRFWRSLSKLCRAHSLDLPGDMRRWLDRGHQA